VESATSSDTYQPAGATVGVLGSISESQGTPGKAPPLGPPTGSRAAALVPTFSRRDGWRPERGAKGHREDHTPGSSHEPSRDPPPEQKDENIKDDIRMRLSLRFNKEQYEALDTSVMREYVRVYRIRYKNVRER
jgi:hypothetical protein